MKNDLRLDYPATSRNRDAILDVLTSILPDHGQILEIDSGSGQHAIYFKAAMPHLDWQTSDPEEAARTSIAGWINSEKLNMPAPLDIDASRDDWPIDQISAIMSINMIHISPWGSCQGLMRGAAKHLPSSGVLYLYGPFCEDGHFKAPSNAAFDASLEQRNPEWGVRDLALVIQEAENNGLVFQKKIEMPSNNLSVIFKKP